MKLFFILALILALGISIWSADIKISTNGILSDLTTTTIAENKNNVGVCKTSTEIIRRNKQKIAIITKTVNKDGVTNTTSSFLVDNSIILTTVDSMGTGCPEKFFIENPITHHVEGFEKNSTADFRPVSGIDIDSFKNEVGKFQ